MNGNIQSLDITHLRELYRTAQATPEDVAKAVLTRADHETDNPIWITRLPATAILAAARALADKDPETLPLYGLPFAVKDNIDVAGYPTTVACPDYAYVPDTSAPVVAALVAAGAILMAAALHAPAADFNRAKACVIAWEPPFATGQSSTCPSGRRSGRGRRSGAGSGAGSSAPRSPRTTPGRAARGTGFARGGSPRRRRGTRRSRYPKSG